MSAMETPAKSPWFKRETSALVLIDHQLDTMQLVKNIAFDASLRNPVLRSRKRR
jgi:hypothetical protein